MPGRESIELRGLRAVRGTLTGAKSDENQDAARIAEAAGGILVCAVADGISSTPQAASAARAAVEATLDAYMANAGAGPDDALRDAVDSAHRAVREATADDSGAVRGATTIVAAVVRGRRLHVANAGDSRAYAFTRDGQLEQITADHSWVEEQIQAGTLDRDAAAVHPWRSVITRYLGGEEPPQIDTFERDLEPGSGVLLCSDGLMGALSVAEVAAILASREPDAAVDALLALARERRAFDDVTVCIAQLAPE